MYRLTKILEEMKSSKVSNYVIAGLDSYLLENGNVRLFKNSRKHQDQITPHSHRFDFVCMVLQGSVTNRVWSETCEELGDFFEVSKLDYSGEIGAHKLSRDGRDFFDFEESAYGTGDFYSMGSNDIHSIDFSDDAIVLFFEGPQVSNKSLIIEPVVNGVKIPTYEKKDYMFLKGDKDENK